MKSYLNLFPPCNLSDCAEKRAEHRHVLAKQRQFIESDAKYAALIGGYGGGKTLPACILGVLLSVTVPGNLGIVIRRSYSKLHDSTERIFLEVMQRTGHSFEAREMRDGWPHRLILSTGSEVVFRESKDLGRFLGPEYGWWLIDEALEEPKKTFVDLIGRLRLPRARKYLKGMIASNPPSERHWIAEVFGEPGRRGDYEMIRMSTRDNPFLHSDYVEDLKKHHPPSEVRRIIEGFYGFTYEGKAVYAPPFDFAVHVGEPEVTPITLVRSWDFGYHCPAVTWHQFWKCRSNRTHWSLLDELAGHDIEAEPFANQVLERTRSRFPQHPPQMVVDCGDIAGRSPTDRGPGPMVRLNQPPWRLVFRARKCNLEPGLGLVRKSIAERCTCGQPIFMAHRRCPQSIDGLAGGYHYPQERPGKEAGDKPVKDGLYDNLLDSVRYAAENFYREAGLDPEILAMMEQQAKVAQQHRESPWSWMGWP